MTPAGRRGPLLLTAVVLLAGCAAGRGTGEITLGSPPAGMVPSLGPAAGVPGALPPVTAAPDSAPASAWPSALGNAAHGSPTSARGPQTGRQRWQRRLEGAVVPGPVVGVDGSVLAASNGGVLHALDPATGRDRWTYDGGGSYGTVRWTFDRGDWTYSSAVVRDGRTWFGDHLGTISQLDLASGRLISRARGLPREQGRTSAGVGFWTAPLVDAAHDVYGGTAAGHVYGFGPDGRRLWDADVGALVASYPALTADGALLIGSSDGMLHAFADR